MDQKTTVSKYFSEVKMLLSQGYDMPSIETKLQKDGLDQLTISDVFKEIKRYKNAQRTQNGTWLSLIGLFLMLIGFVSNVIMHHSDGPMELSLYGITTVGVLLLCAGLYFVFQ